MKRRFKSINYKYAAGAAAILIAGSAWAVHHQNSSNQLPPETTVKTPNASKKSSSPTPTPKPTTSYLNNPSAPAKTITPPTTGTNLELSNQTTFASSHTASSGSSEQSICITTPGASCWFEFSRNGVTKSLVAKVADSDGSASWLWTPKGLGLSVGAWKITAIAKLNRQTKSLTDAYWLYVQ